jgi:hypothetical protein
LAAGFRVADFLFLTTKIPHDKSNQLPDMLLIATGQNQRDVGFCDVRRPRYAQFCRKLFMLTERAINCSPDRVSAKSVESSISGKFSSMARRNVQQAVSGRANTLTWVKASRIVFLGITRLLR